MVYRTPLLVTDLNSLVIFARVVQAQSFSEAARQLGMPLASVSRRIAGLEEQLGVRLLKRSTRHLRLTFIGESILKEAQLSISLCDAVQRTVANHRDEDSGVLRIAAPPALSHFLSIIVLLRAAHGAQRPTSGRRHRRRGAR